LTGWELLHQRTPVFMLVMVPVLAVLRLVLYRYYLRND